MRILYTIILYACSNYISIAQCLKLDLVILADVSGSVSGHEIFINNAIIEFTDKFKKTEVNIGLITFSDGAHVEFHLGDSVRYNIITGGTTDLCSAIDMGVTELIAYGRNGYRKMLLMIFDGAPNDPAQARAMLGQARYMGIGVAGVLILSDNHNREYMKEVCDVFVESDYTTLAEELKKLNLCL